MIFTFWSSCCQIISLYVCFLLMYNLLVYFKTSSLTLSKVFKELDIHSLTAQIINLSCTCKYDGNLPYDSAPSHKHPDPSPVGIVLLFSEWLWSPTISSLLLHAPSNLGAPWNTRTCLGPTNMAIVCPMQLHLPLNYPVLYHPIMTEWAFFLQIFPFPSGD